MESSKWISQALYRAMGRGETAGKEQVSATMEGIAHFFYSHTVPDVLHLVDIERTEDEFIFHWVSDSEQATCECGQVSTNRSKTYQTRRIQDFPMSGMTVWHAINVNRYNCLNPACENKNFFEQYHGFAEERARITNRLKDFIARLTIESSANSLTKSLANIGIKVSRDTILRVVKKKEPL